MRTPLEIRRLSEEQSLNRGLETDFFYDPALWEKLPDSYKASSEPGIHPARYRFMFRWTEHPEVNCNYFLYPKRILSLLQFHFDCKEVVFQLERGKQTSKLLRRITRVIFL